MKKIIIICYVFTTITQGGFAQTSTLDVTPLLKNAFLARSASEGITYEKEGRLYFKYSYQIQRSLPSFGYVSTKVSSQEYKSLNFEQTNILLSIEQQLDSNKLSSRNYQLVRRNEKFFIASGSSFKSCTDSLFQKKVFTVDDFIEIARLKRNFRTGEFELIKNDDSEIRFNYIDEEGTLRYEVYFSGREPDSLKLEAINIEYGEPRDYNLPGLSSDNVKKLIRNSLLQNIIFTRIIRDSVLMDQLPSPWECTNIDELPLSIIPSYEETLDGLEVIKIPNSGKYAYTVAMPMLSAGYMKSFEFGRGEYNGYQFFLVQRLKSKPVVVNSVTGKARYLPLEHHPPTLEVPLSQPPTNNGRAPRLPRRIRTSEELAVIYNLEDQHFKFFELYLVAYQPEKGKIYFLAGNDICLHSDITMYAPRNKSNLPFAKWPKRNQMELIQDKLIPLRAKNLSLDDIEDDASEITGTVSIMSEGKRVTKKISVDMETPYVIRFH